MSLNSSMVALARTGVVAVIVIEPSFQHPDIVLVVIISVVFSIVVVHHPLLHHRRRRPSRHHHHRLRNLDTTSASWSSCHRHRLFIIRV